MKTTVSIIITIGVNQVIIKVAGIKTRIVFSNIQSAVIKEVECFDNRALHTMSVMSDKKYDSLINDKQRTSKLADLTNITLYVCNIMAFNISCAALPTGEQ